MISAAIRITVPAVPATLSAGMNSMKRPMTGFKESGEAAAVNPSRIRSQNQIHVMVQTK